MIKKKTVIKHLKEVQEFCRSRNECSPEKCPLCTGLCYPNDCILSGQQPHEWELPDMGGDTK